MAAVSLSLWSGLGDVFFSQKESFGFAWLYCGEKTEKHVGLYCYACFRLVGKKGAERLSMMLSSWTKTIKSDFMYSFVNWVRLYIEDHLINMIDFVN